jgi:hypothetical protein
LKGGERLFKKVPMKIVVPIIVITWILSLVSALAIASSGLMSLGAIGPKGDTGDTGATGPAGPAGPQGSAGATGATGPAGSTGPAGPAGATGATGSAGPPGANGATWWNGTGVPGSSLGSNGDFYLNLANSDVYNKVSGAWTKVANIEGAAGATVISSGYLTSGVLDYSSTDLGNVTLTAPAAGTVQVIITASLISRNDSGYMWLSSNATGYSGTARAGSVVNGITASENGYNSMTVQGVYSVTANNNYYFKAYAYRVSNYNDAQCYVYLSSVRITAVFYAT